MQKIVVKAFEYDELSEKAQERAREWLRSCVDESGELSYQLSDYLGSELREHGYNPDSLNLEFSLGYCQGDGVAFYGDVDIPFFCKKVQEEGRRTDIPDDTKEWLKKIGRVTSRIHELGYQVRLQITRNSYGWHYSHWNTMVVQLEREDWMYHGHTDDLNRIGRQFMKLEAFFKEDVPNVSKILESSGYALIEYEHSEEVLADQIRVNEYLFTESGSRSAVL
jgi:hypothetical protein